MNEVLNEGIGIRTLVTSLDVLQENFILFHCYDSCILKLTYVFPLVIGVFMLMKKFSNAPSGDLRHYSLTYAFHIDYSIANFL